MGDAKDFFYEVLNIPKHSTADEIRQAYRTLVRRWHPDKHPLSSKHQAEINFKSVTQAYKILIGDGAAGEEEAPTMWKQTYSMLRNQQQQHHRQTRIAEGTLQQLPMNSINRRGNTRSKFCNPIPPTKPTMFYQRKPPPIEKRLECSLEELFWGCKKEVRYIKDVAGSNGAVSKREEVLKVRIKPGWKKGMRVVFDEKGDERPGSIPSDVVLTIGEKTHSYFRRSGNDLLLKVEIPLVNALTGWTFSIRLINGKKMSCCIEDEIITHGYEKIIQGEGMPFSNDKGGKERGDLRIKFSIIFPKQLSQEQCRELSRFLKDCI